MKFKSVKPFIFEMLTLLFVISLIIAGLLIRDNIQISWDLLTIGVVVCVFVIHLLLFSRIVPLGIRALVDYICQNTEENTFVFLKEEPYEASMFTEKFGKDHKRHIGMYYLIHLKNSKEISTFISPVYVDFDENKKYKVKYGKCSKIFISSECVDI